MKRPVAIYTSYNIRYPLGGHVLAELHYMVGLRRLGFRVVVVEESGGAWAPCYDPVTNEMTRDPSYGIAALREVMRWAGLEDCWCYVDSAGQYHGLTATELGALCREAAVLFSRANVTWIDEFAACRRKLFVDVDPGVTQFKLPPERVTSQSGYASAYDFDALFTCGEGIGKPGCPVPLHGLHWRPTRHPVALELVPSGPVLDGGYFRTVMSWSARAPIVFAGEEYGQKDMEFRKIINLPQRVGPVFELGLAGKTAPREELGAAGWRLTDPRDSTRTVSRYLEYIANSRGEFSVAVNLSVKARTGVITDRAITYLAAGKPVILQDTGFSEWLPCGAGLLAFRTADEAAAAVETVNRDYANHCRAARRIAEEYFDSDKVLAKLLTEGGVAFG